jgi:hypothetical protein
MCDYSGAREVVGYVESTQGAHERCSRGTLGVLWAVSIACYATLRLLKRESTGTQRWGAQLVLGDFSGGCGVFFGYSQVYTRARTHSLALSRASDVYLRMRTSSRAHTNTHTRPPARRPADRHFGPSFVSLSHRRICVLPCLLACVCVRVCVFACVCACVCVRACECACVCAQLCSVPSCAHFCRQAISAY